MTRSSDPTLSVTLSIFCSAPLHITRNVTLQIRGTHGGREPTNEAGMLLTHKDIQKSPHIAGRSAAPEQPLVRLAAVASGGPDATWGRRLATNAVTNEAGMFLLRKELKKSLQLEQWARRLRGGDNIGPSGRVPRVMLACIREFSLRLHARSPGGWRGAREQPRQCQILRRRRCSAADERSRNVTHAKEDAKISPVWRSTSRLPTRSAVWELGLGLTEANVRLCAGSGRRGGQMFVICGYRAAEAQPSGAVDHKSLR